MWPPQNQYHSCASASSHAQAPILIWQGSVFCCLAAPGGLSLRGCAPCRICIQWMQHPEIQQFVLRHGVSYGFVMSRGSCSCPPGRRASCMWAAKLVPVSSSLTCLMV